MMGFEMQVFGGVLALIAASAVRCLDDLSEWKSPVYTHMFEFEVPQPMVAVPLTNYTNPQNGVPIDYYELRIKKTKLKLYPELGESRMIGYEGMIPGPTIKVEKGREIVLRVINEGGNSSVVHLHGSHTRAAFDGFANDLIPDGYFKDYYYPNTQSTRLLWYHDHADRMTAQNAYFGQFGAYIIYDPKQEEELKHPCGKYEAIFFLSTAQCDAEGILMSPNNVNHTHYGDIVQVNGQPWPHFKVEPRKYRFRFINAGVARVFKLTLMEGNPSISIPFFMIASDAGYFERPIESRAFFISPGERYEIIVNFAAFRGKKLTLRNDRLAMGEPIFPATHLVMQFVVLDVDPTDMSNNDGPQASLVPFNRTPREVAVERFFGFDQNPISKAWQINNQGFHSHTLLADMELGTVELWSFVNYGSGVHPVHSHLVEMEVLRRDGGLRDGIVEEYEKLSPKDVVLIGPREVVLVIARMEPHAGRYMFHCHNLLHEDNDMMGTFAITSNNNTLTDPMEERWRSKKYEGGPTPDLEKIRSELLPMFATLGAYGGNSQVSGENSYRDYTEPMGRIPNSPLLQNPPTLQNTQQYKTTPPPHPPSPPSPPPPPPPQVSRYP